MKDMLTKTLEIIKIPSFDPRALGSTDTYVLKCHYCGHLEEINALFWNDFLQHPYCSYCKEHNLK